MYTELSVRADTHVRNETPFRRNGRETGRTIWDIESQGDEESRVESYGDGETEKWRICMTA